MIAPPLLILELLPQPEDHKLLVKEERPIRELRKGYPWDLNAARQNGGDGYHDEALCQASTGQEVDDTQPFGKPQVSER